ncbi:hypothetical protein NDU88_006634 [Pleurodeles waltl]|uniref:Uncharacterized protein n=1 Tax=Pleurodeles waltl TaxID=8319 RepID=A0AAV7PRW3_PLEWA|nr:hypothetical protein NDU88_006634 [Pleurodeles waltl]
MIWSGKTQVWIAGMEWAWDAWLGLLLTSVQRPDRGCAVLQTILLAQRQYQGNLAGLSRGRTIEAVTEMECVNSWGKLSPWIHRKHQTKLSLER